MEELQTYSFDSCASCMSIYSIEQFTWVEDERQLLMLPLCSLCEPGRNGILHKEIKMEHGTYSIYELNETNPRKYYLYFKQTKGGRYLVLIDESIKVCLATIRDHIEYLKQF